MSAARLPTSARSTASPLESRSGPLWALAAVAASTGTCWLARPWFHVSEDAMIYLLGVLAAASRLSRRDAVLAALASVAALDFFFVPPYLAFVPSDVRDWLTVVAFLTTSLVVSGYANRVRHEAAEANERERRTAALYQFSRSLSAERGVEGIATIARSHVEDVLGAETAVFRPDGSGNVVAVAGGSTALAGAEGERGVARWVFEHRRPAGRGTDQFPASAGLHVPLVGPGGIRGVIAVAVRPRQMELEPFKRRLLETLAALTAVALERAVLAEEAERARLAVETERTRSTLLSGVSHDLRTPLATITGAAGALLAPGSSLSDASRVELMTSIRDEGDRLGRLVADLLDLTRVESGGFVAEKEWVPVEELITSAVERLRPSLQGRRVDLALPDEMLLMHVDGVLLEQVVVNLLENAAKHTPAGSPVEISVRADMQEIVIEVRDRGEGIPAGEEERIFERFYSLPTEPGSKGPGLGLALCRAIVLAHGGRITAGNRADGGAVFRISLPREVEPVLEAEDDADSSEGEA